MWNVGTSVQLATLPWPSVFLSILCFRHIGNNGPLLPVALGLYAGLRTINSMLSHHGL